MVRDRSWQLLLPWWLRRLPADLAFVGVATSLTVLAVVLPGVRETPLRVVLGLPFVLFFPGYALVAALFPEDGNSGDTASVERPTTEARDRENVSVEEPARRRDIDGIERAALSFGLSIAVVPLLGLVLNFTPWGVREGPVLATVAGFTLLASGAAAHRRWTLPEEERFRVPYSEWASAARSEVLEPASRADAALNVFLVLSILLAAGSVTYAVAVPKQGESFTEFYVLSENETGALVADDYPTQFDAGESKPLVVGIGNHEHQRVDYAVVVVLQRVRFENGTTTVLNERELDRFGATLVDNETWHTEYEVAPTMVGERLRLAFLLYRDGVPPDPTVENAYREIHLRVNVSSNPAG